MDTLFIDTHILENLFLLRIEVVIAVLSFLYIVYYFGEMLFCKYVRNKIFQMQTKKTLSTKTPSAKMKFETSQIGNTSSLGKKVDITPEQKSHLSELVKKVQIHIKKGYNDTAKNLIIEGLAICKFHRDLNLELAFLYEQEKNYKNAEYIYNDLLNFYVGDGEIMKKHGYVLVLQDKFEEAF
ncbi:hypothetical protein MK079_05060, partial [Candidatus Gracilibacteria bacterium]|nr:hypothetical protein [Candidatus Gracilibacteria bacterium]